MSNISYMLIDGENLLTRYEAMISDDQTLRQRPHTVYEPSRYLWQPDMSLGNMSPVVRVSYYTTFVGDEVARDEMKLKISQIGFRTGTQASKQYGGTINPHIFKKNRKSQTTKSVDINMCVDALRHKSKTGLITVILVTGDGDYLPLIEELMRSGVNVHVQALSNGCNPALKHTPDLFRDLDEVFFY